MPRGCCLLLVFVGACTERNPLYCDRNQDCASAFCDVATNTCSNAPDSGADARSPDAAVDAAAGSSVDAATPDAAAHVCSSTCPTCAQQNRACCGTGCCGFGEWCDTSGQVPVCRCGSSQGCGFNTYCCASLGQCGSQCRTNCF